MRKYIIISLTVILVSCSKSSYKNKSEAEFGEKIPTAKVYTTAENTGLRISETDKITFKKSLQPKETEVFILVNPNKENQEFIGIGGAITDASAEVFSKLSKDKQQEFLNAYFDDSENNYNIVRTNINSCDFSSSSYTYIDEGDKDLKTFSIDVDKRFKIPMIKQAIAIIKDDLMFYASPWSPPAFMKSNKNMLRGGTLLPEFNQSWANYYVKFIKAYEQEGIPVWGITIQNEPMATQKWESCLFSAEEERDFLKNFLGPTMEKNGFKDKKIVVWDHNRDLIAHRANTIFEDKKAAKYAWGIGIHWYETWTGAEPNFNNLKTVSQTYPDKKILFTEGCQEKFEAKNYQKWSNAERYGNSMINDFNNGVVGWTDWNILLDQNGGPNHVQNFCFAPIHADLSKNELIYTPSYFYIGHFSRFIKKSAKQVTTSSSRSTLESTSFKNPNNQIVTVVMNKTEASIQYKLILNKKEITVKIPAHAIQTIVTD